MKIGDKVISNKFRPDDVATIIAADIYSRLERPQKGIRTKYVAQYDDGYEITFYGFNINKSVFKYEEPDGQMSIEDFLNPPVEVMS